MINIQEKDKDVLLEMIRNYTGATSICILVADSILPCPDVMSGQKCNHPHRFQVVVDGMLPLAVIDCVAQCAGKTLKDLTQLVDDAEDSD